jgi:hypothetical protein
MPGKRRVSGVAQEAPSESVDALAARIRSLIAEERISSAREWADVALRQHPDSEELKLLGEALYPGGVTRLQLPHSSHRSNMEWLTRHQDEHRGMWVALLDGRLVAVDADLKVVMTALSPLGSDRKPLIHHIRD